MITIPIWLLLIIIIISYAWGVMLEKNSHKTINLNTNEVLKLLCDIQSFCQAFSNGHVSSMNDSLMVRINKEVERRKENKKKQS